MLTLLVILFVILGACVLVCIVGALTALVIVALSRDPAPRADSKRSVPVVEDEVSSDQREYDSLAREMLLYASQFDVSYHQEIEMSEGGCVCVRTTTDRFGRKRYVERQRRYAEVLHCTLCLYEHGDWIPSAHAIRDVPAAQIEWGAYQQHIRDIRERGSKLSYWDARGQHQQVRLPVKFVEVRV